MALWAIVASNLILTSGVTLVKCRDDLIRRTLVSIKDNHRATLGAPILQHQGSSARDELQAVLYRKYSRDTQSCDLAQAMSNECIKLETESIQDWALAYCVAKSIELCAITSMTGSDWNIYG